jgi:hypothetical protein
MGTPTYMSPEQCKGTGEVDTRADLYSLGCIFYEMLVGVPPFTNLGAGELIGAHLYLQPQSPSKRMPGISAEADALIMALLDKSPANRPQTAKELAQRLTAMLDGQGWTSALNPTGITAEDLRPLPVVDRSDTPDEAATIARTTPFKGDEQPKPTTLSGAASQVDIQRPRMGVAIAVGVMALVSIVVVAVIKISGGGSAESHAAAPPPPAKIEPAKVEPPPAKVEAAKIEPVKVEPPPPPKVEAAKVEKVEPVKAVPVKVESHVVAKKPVHPHVATPPPAPPPPPPPPPKKPDPTTNQLIETNLD